METISLYEEYRLVERSETEVNGAWKGAHLLLFFLAFVFGSFCTFCFHMLMYLFDEKCVLFPKLLALTSLKQNIIYEFIPEDREMVDMLPVDFLSTQWVDKSACYLPTYVPLLSGIFGLVWTTMFLMCSTGSRTLTGLQRPWRVLLPVLIFSLAMGGLCLYATIITHYGLHELCIKLGEITGSTTCSYTVNVVTLAFERRIRGVYQATRITILSAWLHTLCWLLSALLTLVRVLLVVDFQLVKVTANLRGNLERMLERHERQIRTVFPETWVNKSHISTSSQSSVKVHFQKNEQTSRFADTSSLDSIDSKGSEGHFLFACAFPLDASEPSLVEDERIKIERSQAISALPGENQFILKMLYDLIDMIDIPMEPTRSYLSPSLEGSLSAKPLIRQYGQQAISSSTAHGPVSSLNREAAEKLVLEIQSKLEDKLKDIITEGDPSTSKRPMEFESVMNITPEMRQTIKSAGESNVKGPSVERKKSNLKDKNVQTLAKKKTKSPKVQITESKTITEPFDSGSDDEDQKPKKKEPEKPKKEKED